MALRSREVAKEHEVPIVENPPLVRALFAIVPLDEEVSPEHDKAVAPIIGSVLRMASQRAY